MLLGIMGLEAITAAHLLSPVQTGAQAVIPP